MNTYIERLNREFGESPSVGWIPPVYGKREPQYKWAFTGALTYRGIVRGKIESIPMHETDCWAVVKFEPPIGESEWQERYGADLAYEYGGQWVLTDFRMPPGVEPTEAITRGVIDAIARMRATTAWDNYVRTRAEQERKDAAARSEVYDLIDDTCLTYDAVPGTRSGLRSFGGFEESQPNREETKNDTNAE